MSNAAFESSINSTTTLIVSSVKISFLSYEKCSSLILRFLPTLLTTILAILASNKLDLFKTSYNPFPTHPNPKRPMFNLFLIVVI